MLTPGSNLSFKRGFEYTRKSIGEICYPGVGRPAGGNWDTWCSMKDSCLSVTEFKNMPADVSAKVQSVADSISSGSFDVFQGPIITNAGTVVAGGATLNDGDLWGMNYYVQGVIGKIPN